MLISLVVLVMRKRIDLVVSLFREAGKAIHAMPLLLFQPIWVNLSLKCTVLLLLLLLLEVAYNITSTNSWQFNF